MSNIIKEIEAEQLKATVDQFEVGDTVKVYGKIKEGRCCTEETGRQQQRDFHC